VGISAILSFLILFGTIGQVPGHGGGEGHKAAAEHAAAPGFSSEAHTVGYNKVLFNWVTAGTKERPVLDENGAPVLDKNGKPAVETVADFNAEAGFWFDPLTA
jgi:hypothetical protein